MKHILAVDDMSSVLSTLKYMLRTEYQIYAVTSGELAMDFLEKEIVAIDLILLDVDMPGISGLEVLRTLKSHPTLRDIPVIMLTGDATMDTVMMAASVGIIDYIVKPFTEDILKKKLHAAFKHKGSRPSG